MAHTITYVTRKDIYKVKHKALFVKDLELKHFLLNAETLSITNQVYLISSKGILLKRLK